MPGDVSPDGGHILSSSPKPGWVVEAQFYVKAAIPLALGAFAFVILMYSATSNGPFSAKNLSLIPPSPFRGVQVVYAMIFASLITVLAGTCFYVGELKHMAGITRRTSGASQLLMARLLIWVAIVILVGYVVIIAVFRQNVIATDACNLHLLHERVFWHDACVGTTFSLFLIADCLTLIGMSRAGKACAGRPDRSGIHKEIMLGRDFSTQQLWLIDFPVLLGFAVSIVIVASANLLQGWDSATFYLNPSVLEGLAIRRDTTLFMCSNHALDLREFQYSVGSIFSAGIAMGYLAAHVFMSQVVFIVLNVFFGRKRAQLHASEGHA